jgi:hypothetical protein
MSDESTSENGTPAERSDAALDEALETAAEAQEEIIEAVEGATDEVEEAAEEAAEDVEEVIEAQAEEVATATGLDEATVRAMIREELAERFPTPAEDNGGGPVVTETTTTVVEPEPSLEPEPDVAPVVGGSFAARFLAPRKRG